LTTVREFVISGGQTVKEGVAASGRVRCPICKVKILAQPVVVRDGAAVKHYDEKQREHPIGVLEQREGRWYVIETPPAKRPRRLKGDYPTVYVPVVTNAVGRGKRQ
jgi:hypothetical protein